MPFVVILARGIQVSRLGCHGAAWSLTPNFDQIASQSLVFDYFLRENTQPKLWGAQLATRPNPWCWSGETPGFANQSPNLHLVEGHPKTVSGFQVWLETIWSRLAENQADLLVIELLDAVPPWNPDREDLEAYFPRPSEELPNGTDFQGGMNQKDSSEGFSNHPLDEELSPWKGPLKGEPRVSSQSPPARENLLLTHGAAIATLDKKLGVILDFLAGHQTPDTHILLTSDQGIALGEKGLYGHGVSVPWLDMVNVPLIWCHPSREANSLRHSALVSDKDLNELLQGDPKTPQGLLEKCWDAPRESGNKSVVTFGLNKAFACRNRDWSLVVEGFGAAKLFEFPMDRWEVNDLGARHPNELHSLLSHAENAPLSPSCSDQPGGQPS